ncbi:hypothetical protein D9M71_564190 [compost metagenome]
MTKSTPICSANANSSALWQDAASQRSLGNGRPLLAYLRNCSEVRCQPAAGKSPSHSNGPLSINCALPAHSPTASTATSRYLGSYMFGARSCTSLIPPAMAFWMPRSICGTSRPSGVIRYCPGKRAAATIGWLASGKS